MFATNYPKMNVYENEGYLQMDYALFSKNVHCKNYCINTKLHIPNKKYHKDANYIMNGPKILDKFISRENNLRVLLSSF